MSSADRDAIHVVCVTDENYAPHFSALLNSIDANRGGDTVVVHAIHDAVKPETRAAIDGATPGLTVHWYSVGDHPALTLPPLLQISRATYLRLVMEEVLDPAIARVIYLDIDMIATSSLRELWEVDLGDNVAAAVPDPGVPLDGFTRTYGLDGEGRYFNAGMIVFDMQRARARGTLSGALKLLLAGDHPFELADQDALNVTLWRAWLPLDAAWNFQRKFLYDTATYKALSSDRRRDPRIIHYTEACKPWRTDEWHPFAWLYWKNLLRSPFAKQVMAREKVGPRHLLKWWLKYHFKRPNYA